MKHIFIWKFQIFVLNLKIFKIQIEKIFVHIYFWILIATKKFQLRLIEWKYRILVFKSEPITLEGKELEIPAYLRKGKGNDKSK